MKRREDNEEEKTGEEVVDLGDTSTSPAAPPRVINRRIKIIQPRQDHGNDMTFHAYLEMLNRRDEETKKKGKVDWQHIPQTEKPDSADGREWCYSTEEGNFTIP